MKKRIIINSLVILFALSPVLYLLLAWDSIPDTFVTRFKLGEIVEDRGPKATLILAAGVISLASVLLYAVLRNLHKVDPKVTAETPRSGFDKLGTVLCVFMTIANFFFIVSVSNSAVIHVNVIFAVVGLFVALAGNYMNNIKPNYVAGIRVPWTLNDPDNWRRTHHLASKLWFTGGILIILISIAAPGKLLIPLLIAVALVLIIVPGLYSYRIHKSKIGI